MWLIKLPFKIIAIPLMLVITLVQWFGVFLVGCSAVILNLFAGLCFMLAIFCYLTQISTGSESIQMLITGFVVFMVPVAGEWIIDRIMDINVGLRNFIRS